MSMMRFHRDVAPSLPPSSPWLLVLLVAGLAMSGPASAQDCRAFFEANPRACAMPPMTDFESVRPLYEKCCCWPQAGCPDEKARPPAPVRSSIAACPALPGRDGVAIIPANSGATSVVSYAGSPGRAVQVWIDPAEKAGMQLRLGIPDTGRGQLLRDARYDVASRSRPATVRLDAGGKVRVAVIVKVQGDANEPATLPAPVDFKVNFREEGQKADTSVTVRVGLGVQLTGGKLVFVSSDKDGQANHVWRGSVASRFHPGLDLKTYVDSFEACDPDLPTPQVNIQSVWLRRPADGVARLPLVDGIGGAEQDAAPNTSTRTKVGVKYTFGRDPQGVAFLRPLDFGAAQPYRTYGDQVYPGVAQQGDGQFTKGYYGFMRVSAPDAEFYAQSSLEPRVLSGLPYTFSLDSPDKLYMSLLCMFQVQDREQAFALQVLSLLPFKVGDGVDLTMGMLDGTCLLARGKYEDALKKIGWALSKPLLGALVKEKLVPALTNSKGNSSLYRYLGMPEGSVSLAENQRRARQLEDAYEYLVAHGEFSTFEPPAK